MIKYNPQSANARLFPEIQNNKADEEYEKSQELIINAQNKKR